MTTLRKKLPLYKLIERREESRVASQLGNLYGISLENLRGAKRSSRSAERVRSFKELLDRLRSSKGSSAVHRARREDAQRDSLGRLKAVSA